MLSPDAPGARTVGRYALSDEIARGGMATVHIGRVVGSAGFARTVAIKRLHPQYARDPDFVAMFVDEARLAARIHHPNVVSTLDVVALEGELFLVMEYIQGESFARLERLARDRGERVAEAIVASVLAGVLHGLHAAHEARGERGEPLGIVHRDVSPQNVMVGVDGVARVLDFGIAKAAGRIQTTRDGQIKGKLAYMPPEQLRGEAARTTDVYAAGVVLWEALAGRRLFDAESEGDLVTKVIQGCREPPSAWMEGVAPELDAITMRALNRDPKRRFPTARDMARALEDAVVPVATSKIGDWVAHLAAGTLLDRATRVESLEKRSARSEAVATEAPHTGGAKNGGASIPSTASRDPPVVEEVVLTQLATGVASHPTPIRARPRWWVPVATAGLLVGAVGSAALLHGRHDVAESASPSTRQGPPITVAESVRESQPAVSSAAAAASAASACATSTASAPEAVTRSASPSRSSPRRPMSRAQGSVSPSRGAHCDPPYYFDSDGVRIFRKECL
jgi:serine/threonine protein kinase